MYCFFDLDQTLIAHDTQALFCQHVLRRHPIRRWFLASYIPALLLYPVLGKQGLKRVFLNYLWRLPMEELKLLVSSFVQETVLPAIYPDILAELRQHQANGLVSILNTASPDFYAHEIATALGFHHCYATKIDLKGKARVPFLPGLLGPNNKREAKIDQMAELKLPPSPIPGSYAYSDSHTDLPLLLLAEHPILVHPTESLALVGKEKHWPVRLPKRPFQTKLQHLWQTLRQITGCRPL